MPIPDTKYNDKPSYKLKIDLCNNSFFYTNRTNHHIFTCDISDTLSVDGLGTPVKIYLDSKASFLIHPFSKVSNCVTQFSSTNNSAFKYKKPIPCPIEGPTSHNAVQTQNFHDLPLRRLEWSLEKSWNPKPGTRFSNI
jgi:hypothetical protein